MNKKHALLVAMLIPGLAVLAACNDRDADDAVAADATTAPASADSVPAAPMPVATMPAPEADMGNGISFAGMDKNQDGAITKDELADTDTLYQKFSAVDTDRDGKLTQAEFIWHLAEMKATPAK
ncbi:MAG: hypothetical protein ACOH1L_10245 [Thermomonas sp.]